MTSIRRFLMSRVLLSMCVVLVIGQIALYVFVSKRLVAQFDETLTAKARAFAGLIEQEPNGVMVELRNEFFQEYTRRHDPEYFQVWHEDGAIIARSSSLGEDSLPPQTGTLERPRIWNMTLPDGRPGRAIGIRFFPPPDEEYRHETGPPAHVEFVLARDRREIMDVLSILLFGTGVTMLLLIGGIVLVVSWVTRRGLSPLTQLADHTATITARTLGSRYDERNLPDELKPIVGRLNALLDRLQVAFERERRLTADMAHELKTPLSELKSLAEVALAWPDDHGFIRKTLTDTVEISDQMNRMVSLLLTLNRCEASQEAVSPSFVDLSALLREQWQPWHRAAEEKRICVDFNIPDHMGIMTDKTMLSSIMMNLFSNAVEYCPAHGRITCDIRQLDQRVIISVSNSNESLTDVDLPVMFEKLWRKDYARGGGIHSGLGLTLVSAFAGLLGITIETSLDNGAFRISLNIPQTLSSEASLTH